MSWQYQSQKKKKKKVPIKIQGLGTFYVERKYLLYAAGIGTLGIIALGAFLVWLQTARICNFVFPC